MSLVEMAESNPVIIMNFTGPVVEGENITYTCQVTYRGNLLPKMQWSTNLMSINDTIDESVPGQSTKVTIKVKAETVNNGWVYKCLTYFDAPVNPGVGYATNAPSYEYQYQSTPLVVHCEYDDLQIFFCDVLYNRFSKCLLKTYILVALCTLFLKKGFIDCLLYNVSN